MGHAAANYTASVAVSVGNWIIHVQTDSQNHTQLTQNHRITRAGKDL